jgi:hypothetical protein
MKRYLIQRIKGVVVATVNEQPLRIITYHARDSIDFGNAGKESQDLALSILADFYEEQPTPDELHRGSSQCWQPHQKFTWRFIASSDESIAITDAEIRAWLEQTQADRRTP